MADSAIGSLDEEQTKVIILYGLFYIRYGRQMSHHIVGEGGTYLSVFFLFFSSAL